MKGSSSAQLHPLQFDLLQSSSTPHSCRKRGWWLSPQQSLGTTVTGLTRKQHVDSGHRGRSRSRRRHRFGLRIDEQARQRVDQNAERWDNVVSAAANVASIEQQLVERSDDRRGTRWPRLKRLKKITEPAAQRPRTFLFSTSSMCVLTT